MSVRIESSYILVIISIIVLAYSYYHHQSFLPLLPTPSSSSSSSLYDESIVIVSKQVRYALDHNLPVVSLESTIITHGMPYPQNYDTAVKVEQTVRDNGATPATIAIINGRIHVGLSNDQLLHLSKVGKEAIKTSRRDIAILLSKSSSDRVMTGSTTVSSTILISKMVGIKVFVTGGIGGVHREAESTMDISADLTELARNDVAVVCAGVKSILDIGKTLEFLETHGVTVATYQSDYFPSFFTSSSQYKSPNRIESALDAASIIHSNHLLHLNSGIVIAIPNRYEFKQGIDIDVAIEEALLDANKQNIKGKDVTPFLLNRVNEITRGESLQSNIHLIIQNAIHGSKIAYHLSSLSSKKKEIINNSTTTTVNSMNDNRNREYKVTVVGGAVVDMISHASQDSGFQMGTSNPGTISYKMGGVGRNIAETLTRLHQETLFISTVGDDHQSSMLIDHLQSLNASTHAIQRISSHSTATYNAIFNKGDLVVAIAIMSVFDRITPSYVDEYKKEMKQSKMIVFDGNIPIDTMISLVDFAKQNAIPTFFEPTSVYKSTKPITTPLNIDLLPYITYTSPNADELFQMSSSICQRWRSMSNNKDYDDNDTKKQLCHEIDKEVGQNQQQQQHQSLVEPIQVLKKQSSILILAGIKIVIVKAGISGVYIAHKSSSPSHLISFKHYDAPSLDSISIIDVNGAGDSFVGCFIHHTIINHINTNTHTNSMIDESVRYGTLCAKSTLQSSNPVSDSIHPDLFNIK